MPPKKQLALKAEASKKPGEVKPAPKKSKRTVTKALPVCCSFEDAKFDSIYEGFIDFLKREGFEIED